MRPFDVRLVDSIASGAPYHAKYATTRSDGSIGAGFYFRRDYWEVTAIVAGEADNIVLGPDGRVARRERIRAGSMFVWRPQDLHAVVPVGPRGMEFVQVCFAPAAWLLFADLMGVRSAAMSQERAPSARFEPDDAAVLDAFETAVRALDGTPTMVDLARFWIEVVPLLLPVSGRPGPGVGGPSWLSASVEAMRSEPNLRAGLPRLLELARVGRRQLARVTRGTYGLTPTELVTDLRMRHAARLLTTTTDSVARIARRVGIADPAYFSARFRAATSVSPTEYRDRSAASAAG
jgi:AraC-like DNA-binding protein